MPADGGLALGRRLAIASVIVSALLAVLNVGVGLTAGSAAVVALGVEFAGDVLASAVVLFGLLAASRPPDQNHPYGHGRLETVAGLLVGFVLATAGGAIIWRAIAATGPSTPPTLAAAAVLLVAASVRAVMAAMKIRVARRIGSLALRADGWNDAVDILSALIALVAVSLTRLTSGPFLDADRYGAVAVGLIVIATGVRLARAATLDLADTMPDRSKIDAVRAVALAVPGVHAVEKQYARKTGLQYHIDLHVEVDPEMTVRESHRIAHEVQALVRQRLRWVADVLVHVEPSGGVGHDVAGDGHSS